MYWAQNAKMLLATPKSSSYVYIHSLIDRPGAGVTTLLSTVTAIFGFSDSIFSSSSQCRVDPARSIAEARPK